MQTLHIAVMLCAALTNMRAAKHLTFYCSSLSSRDWQLLQPSVPEPAASALNAYVHRQVLSLLTSSVPSCTRTLKLALHKGQRGSGLDLLHCRIHSKLHEYACLHVYLLASVRATNVEKEEDSPEAVPANLNFGRVLQVI